MESTNNETCQNYDEMPIDESPLFSTYIDNNMINQLNIKRPRTIIHVTKKGKEQKRTLASFHSLPNQMTCYDDMVECACGENMSKWDFMEHIETFECH